MIPYAHLTYFCLVFAIILPMIVAARRGLANSKWILGATVVMLLVQYYPKVQITRHIHWPELVPLAAFGLYQWALIRMALTKRLPGGSRWAIPLGLFPLIVSKFLPEIAPQSQFGFAGISYVTFRALDVLWAVTDGVLREVECLDFLVYLFFFPTISSGPIDRFRRFNQEWRQTRSREQFREDFDAGLPLFFRGLLYKFVIATLIERHLLETTRTTPGVIGAVEYAYTYSAYLFFDFAGYSAFAVGVSRWFGIHTPENFNLPWAARNIREFWNRWHMSLSFWFRDHVYTRFLITAVKAKWFRSREIASNAGYLVSFGLMGLWHGLTGYYILYGFYHAALLAGFDAFSRWRRKRPEAFKGLAWQGAAHVITIHVVVFGFWIFSGHAWQPRSTGVVTPAKSMEVIPEDNVMMQQ